MYPEALPTEYSWVFPAAIDDIHPGRNIGLPWLSQLDPIQDVEEKNILNQFWKGPPWNCLLLLKLQFLKMYPFFSSIPSGFPHKKPTHFTHPIFDQAAGWASSGLPWFWTPQWHRSDRLEAIRSAHLPDDWQTADPSPRPPARKELHRSLLSNYGGEKKKKLDKLKFSKYFWLKDITWYN